MPSWRDINSGVTGYAEDVQQIIDVLRGTPGKGIPVSMTAVDSATDYAQEVKNVDDTVGKVFRAIRGTGTVLLDVLKSGVSASPDGSSSQPIVTVGHTQTLTNKTLSGPVLVSPKTYRGTAIAAVGAVVTLPGDGTNYRVTAASGTCDTITASAALDGVEIELEFASGGVVLRNGTGNLRLSGHYVSLGNSTLTLRCDGTSWTEYGRSGAAVVGCSLYRTANQAIAVSSTPAAINWQAAQWNYGGIWSLATNPSQVRPGFAGKFRASGAVSWEQHTGDSWRAYVYKSGALYRVLANGEFSNIAGATSAQSFSVLVDLGAADFIEVRVVHSDTSGPRLVVGTISESTLDVQYVGA